MTAFQKLEARVRTAWHDLTTDARQELGVALDDAKAELGSLKPLLQTFEADAKAELAKDVPDKAALVAMVEKLLADGLKIAGVSL